jgi:hypothetical protein
MLFVEMICCKPGTSFAADLTARRELVFDFQKSRRCNIWSMWQPQGVLKLHITSTCTVPYSQPDDKVSALQSQPTSQQ